MKKKILSLLLVLVMVLSLIPSFDFSLRALSDSAAVSGTTGDCQWYVSDTVLHIVGSGAMDDYTIVGMAGNYGSDFPWGNDITKLVVHDGVTTIGSAAFYECRSLVEIEIPGSVTSIGARAFDRCSGLTSVKLPDGVTTMGSYAFARCTSLASIQLPGSVTCIGDSAFYNCYAFRDVWYVGARSDVSNISIGSNEKLTSVNWHYIDNPCDSQCNDCGKVYDGAHIYDSACDAVCSACGFTREPIHVFGEDCEAVCSACGFIRTPPEGHQYGSDCTAQCARCGFVRVPAGEHTYSDICDTVCNGCGFTRTLPYDSYGATGDCLWYVVGTKLTVTGTGAMADYTPFSPAPWGKEITEAVLEDGVTVIGGDAFSGCQKLQSVTIPASVSIVSKYAFDACTALADVWYGGNAAARERMSVEEYNTALQSAYWHYTELVGDLNADGILNMDDAIYLLFYTSFPEDYPLNQSADFDGNDEVNMDDAIYLLFHTSFPSDYPLL